MWLLHHKSTLQQHPLRFQNNFKDQKKNISNTVFSTCHTSALEWIYTLTWMSRNSLHETGTISEAQVTTKGLGIYQIRPVWLNGWVFIYKLNVVGSNSVAVRKIFLLWFKRLFKTCTLLSRNKTNVRKRPKTSLSLTSVHLVQPSIVYENHYGQSEFGFVEVYSSSS